MTIYTIGFTKRSAKDFFEALRGTDAKHVLDIRLHNTSQLAGYTKRNDLEYFLQQVLGMRYHEVPVLAPEETELKAYRKGKDWARFEVSYVAAVRRRHAERCLDVSAFEEGAVLLCSETTPDRCHRRLAAEYVRSTLLPAASIVHL